MVEELINSPFDAIRCINGENEFWRAREIAKVLGYIDYRNFQKAIEKAKFMCDLAQQDTEKHFFPTICYFTIGKGVQRKAEDYQLSKYAVYLILACLDLSKTQVAQALAYFTLTALDHPIPHFDVAKQQSIFISSNIEFTKEQRTVGEIMRAFNHLDMVQQYRIDPYKVDLYFPKERIAIECDEDGHRRYPPEAEKHREKYITEKLKCSFVRYNPDSPDFNIGGTINKIMMLIYEKQILLPSAVQYQ